MWAEIERLRAEIERLRALAEGECRRAEDAHGMTMRQTLEIERLRAALKDLIDRWSDERGYDGAIRRARALLLDHAIKDPKAEDVRSALRDRK